MQVANPGEEGLEGRLLQMKSENKLLSRALNGFLNQGGQAVEQGPN